METKKLTFKKDFVKDSFKLIELNTPEQIDTFQSGTTIVIKGLEDDEAVLCTDTKTFIVRRMHNSNSALLVNQENSVEDNVSSTIDLIPCLGRLDRIDSLLSGVSYEGEENEEKVLNGKTLYTMKDMLSIVQASEKELLSGLEKRSVFVYNTYCRTFDKTWLFQLFDAFMTNALLHGLDIHTMTLERAKDCILEERSAVDEDSYIPDEILKSALSVFATLDEGERLKFDERKSCRFLGEWLLSNPRVLFLYRYIKTRTKCFITVKRTKVGRWKNLCKYGKH
ncbi:sister chromatid cohesion protein Dcc1 [Sporodiniella umbellata]|nr:sister chromatid cohesion protein Dcc1 [Sporodiniella umbellata]